MDSVYSIQVTTPNTHLSGYNYYVDTLSGIYLGRSSHNSQMVIYPNPNNGHFILEANKNDEELEISSIEIWGIRGRLIRKIETYYRGYNYSEVIDLTELQPAVYILKLKNNNDVMPMKFVIQK